MSEMVTMETVLSEMRDSVGKLQSAEQTVIDAKDMIMGAALNASQASTAAAQAQTTAAEASSTAENAKMIAEGLQAAIATNQTAIAEAKEIAEAALPLDGGEMSGPVSNLTLSGLTDDLYDAHAVSAQWTKNLTARKVRSGEIIHIGGENASDTANLHEGRGSAEMPFATLLGAAAFASHEYAGGKGYLTFELHEDQVVDTLDLRFANIMGAYIKRDSTRRKIIVSNRFCLRKGFAELQNVEIVASGTPKACVECNGQEGNPKLRIGEGVVFSGATSYGTIYSYNGGWVTVGVQPTGTATGRRYYCANRAVITAGANVDLSALPGSQVGNCDAGSFVTGA